MSTSNTPKSIVDFVCESLIPIIPRGPQKHLDIGAGWGHLIRKLQALRPEIASEACDYPIALELRGIPTKEVDLGKGALPYHDHGFDIVTCTEVFEHIENPHPIVREIYRVLKPGGLAVISTPNILNLRSRMRFLTCGTYEFFDPLPTKADLGGRAWMRHITPLTFFYLSLMLIDTGFEKPLHHPGKTQKFSAALFLFFAPFFRVVALRGRHRRARPRGIPVTKVCEDLASEHNGWNLMTSRTLIVSARKPLTVGSLPKVWHPEPAPESLPTN